MKFNYFEISRFYHYKGYRISRYDVNGVVHLVPRDLLVDRIVKLTFWDKLRKRTLEDKVQKALKQIYEEIDDLELHRQFLHQRKH